MKNLFLFILILLSGSKAAISQVTFGPQVGLNLSNYVQKSHLSQLNTSIKAGVRAGFIFNIKLSSELSLQPAVSFVQNGWNFYNTDKLNYLVDTASSRVNTIEFPVSAVYKMRHIFMGFGAYLGYNISGKNKKTENRSTETTKLYIWPDKSDDILPIDIGFVLSDGYQFDNGFFVRIHYQRSAIDLSPDYSTSGIIYNYNYGITIGWLGGGNDKQKKTKTPSNSKM